MRFGPQQRLRIELNNTRAGSNPLEQRRTSDWLDLWALPQHDVL
jgi:hypothetical protein